MELDNQEEQKVLLQQAAAKLNKKITSTCSEKPTKETAAEISVLIQQQTLLIGQAEVHNAVYRESYKTWGPHAYFSCVFLFFWLYNIAYLLL